VILTFELLTSNLMYVISHGVGNNPRIFSVSGTFRSRHMGQQLSDGPRDFATLTFNLEGHGVVGNTGLRASSVYQVCST